ncbi:39S ribosomal protein L47, mitochondrial [Thalassophryne amazonica]|uniref:39S ribosomal protein L47, mitochondrial n=1 Tax=Thalassophryne amazonica TaxID=390379 RepID=UPI0014721DCF|nr:39S ribosomal protein L47, mitochondrial [Thalassophryne amazonica]
MALSSAGRVLTICEQFQNFFRISSAINTQLCAVSLSKSPCGLYREKSPFIPSSWSNLAISLGQCRSLHTTVSRRGLEEFFDYPENWGETTVKSGAPWTVTKLRAKSNEDLHKLWYVLLKEMNMLRTLEQESKRQRLPMPSPERIKKVQRSMTRMDIVVNERESALRLLQTGQENPRPRDWRKNVFGEVRWYQYKEHPIPWYLNTRYKRTKYFTPKFVEPHIRLRLEKDLRIKLRKAATARQKLAKLKEKFPHMKVPAQ